MESRYVAAGKEVIHCMKSIRLVRKIRIADTFIKRLIGLLGTRDLPEDTGLLLTPCRRVHTWGMQYAIDVLHLDEDHRVLAISSGLPPNTFGRKVTGTCQVLEVKEDLAAAYDIQVGDRIEIANSNGEKRDQNEKRI